ncbi:Disease resistance protein CC-NBS-LRR class family [Prunus dulcis]|uniref:Disease resistance protein CC-NBS-LRR class family n=1 Tax=Prunus dulcis TaxID=3755 RepID=A0A5H2Y407_PRUDU|nr:Disease resistance protein CC-NBS-LRR class family [Prunus dulcis]
MRYVKTPKEENVVGTSNDEHQSSRSFERAGWAGSSSIFSFTKIEDFTYDNSTLLEEHSAWIPGLLENLEELNIAQCWEMETIVRSADENEKEDQTSMTLFPKLNSFDLDWLPTLESLCPDASTSLWSAAKVMSVKRCHKLKKLASVIPQIKKLQKYSTAHRKDEDEGISSGSCGCTPYSCDLMTKTASRTNIVQILPRPVNQEVAPTNLDQDSNDYDNLERLSVLSCESLEVVFQLKGPKAVESHNVQAFNKLCYLLLNKLPSLMHVWETGGSPHITGFGNLTFLSVSHCGSLRYLFLSTVAKLLISLKDLKVGNCVKIEQVIAEADTECVDQEITFRQLNSITLEDLPNLICFSIEAYTLKFPCLRELKGNTEKCRAFCIVIKNTPRLVLSPKLTILTFSALDEHFNALSSVLKVEFCSEEFYEDVRRFMWTDLEAKENGIVFNPKRTLHGKNKHVNGGLVKTFRGNYKR